MFNTQKVGKKIAEMRKARNMTQMELADTMGVSYQAVSNWERGNSMPDISKLPELVEIFGCTIDELLSSSQETELLNNIIEGNTKEYVQNHQITVETVSKAAPVLKPNQTKSIIEMILDENMEKIAIDELIGIAPFVEEEFLDKWVEKIDIIENANELTKLAPFLSEATLDGLVEKLTDTGNTKEIRGLAPFLSRETLDELVRQLYDVGNTKEIRGLAPFLSRETLDELIKQLYDVGSTKEIRGLAPFLSKEALDELVLKMIEDGDVENCTGLYPFLSRDTLYKLADILVKKYGFNGIKDLAPFL